MIRFFLTTMTFLAISPLLSTSALAASGVKRDILNLTRQIEDALLNSSASDSSLENAKEQLESALQLIQESSQGGTYPQSDCMKFAYEKYYMTLSSSAAMDKASQACRGNDSVEVMQFLYEKFYIVTSSNAAMDKAADLSKDSVSGKLPIIRFAFDKYYQVKAADASATKAARGAQNVSSGALSCVQMSYDNYYRTQSSDQAMDSAFKACAR